MSTPLYDALVAKVRDWSNRDTESLPDSILKDSLNYAAETAYRELRIQGMESVFTFTATAQGNTFDIPADLKEFISLRQIAKVSNLISGTQSYVYTATAGQSLFKGADDNGKTLSYVEGSIMVILNGIYLAPSDFTATDGIGVNLTVAASLNDELQIITFNSVIDGPSTNVFEYTATASQTTFTGVDTNNNTLKYKVGNVLVTKNGVFLVNGTDYTATNTTSVVLTTGATSGDKIQIVTVNELAATSANSTITEDDTTVYDNKSDYRSFMSDATNKYSYHRWTRQADKIIVHPLFSAGDKFELFYYSDGSDLGTNYAVTASNFALGHLTYTNDSSDTALYFKSTVTGEPDPVTDTASNSSTSTYNTAKYFKGKEKPHFLRDNQERLLIYLSLSFINDYLGENNESQKYAQKSGELIQRINNAEVFKQSSGGNVRVNFDGPLI